MRSHETESGGRRGQVAVADAGRVHETPGVFPYTLVRWKFRWERDGVGPR